MGVAALKRGHFVSQDCNCLLLGTLLQLTTSWTWPPQPCVYSPVMLSVGVVVGVAGAVLTVSSLGPGLASTELLLPDSLSPSRATALQY